MINRQTVGYNFIVDEDVVMSPHIFSDVHLDLISFGIKSIGTDFKTLPHKGHKLPRGTSQDMNLPYQSPTYHVYNTKHPVQSSKKHF